MNLNTAIDNHRDAYQSWMVVLGPRAKKCDSEVTEAEEQACTAGSDAEWEAFYELCACPCTNMEEVRQKAKYLLHTSVVTGFWDDDAKAFLESLAQEVQS